MDPFMTHRGIAAPLLLDNVDTDQIIPSREMKQVSKTGLSGGMFSGQRYLYDGLTRTGENPDFVLNQAGFRQASILLSGKNFGCGSSREHAVWALAEFGFKVLIAQSFGTIFRNNCVRNGILPIDLSEKAIQILADQVSQSPATAIVSVDLEQGEVIAPNGQRFVFDIDPYYRTMLLNGWDFIDLALQREEEINQFCASDKVWRAWAHL